MDYEKLGLFYLGRRIDNTTGEVTNVPLLYDAADLVTHAVILGMTGSGKTGLGIGLIEEAAIDGIPVLVVDPKGDLANLLLTFPNLSTEEFAAWTNPDEARSLGLSAEAFAGREATRWREGLAEWDQTAERVTRLRHAAEFAIYTPGSRAARPLSILRTFQAPTGAAATDPELLSERASGAATSVLTLAGIEAEPLRSREHILVSTLLSAAWQQHHSLDLPALIAQVQNPPLTKVGVLDLEAFFPAGDRFALAADLNRLLAAPDFAVWLEGDPLDIGTLLYSPAGKPRVSVLSIAHLDDHERMFFVTLLLTELVSWMRAQRGTSTLRALVYFDEMMGFLPPVAMPPSKPPLLKLLKQARAFGIGMTLATQNPIDLDYKALSNAGTWFLGRLQTERDKARLLDGLEGVRASSGHGFDRATTDTLLSGLEKRTFLLHNVHEEEPVLFKTRWTLSYLRGPLGRDELSRLAPPTPSAPASTSAPPHPVTAAPGSPVAGTPAPGTSPAPPPRTAAPSAPPVLDPAVPQYFAPGEGERWTPALVGAARLHYADAKLGIDETRDVIVTTPIEDGPLPVDWEHATPASFAVTDLGRTAPRGAVFDPVPPPAAAPRRYGQWTKDFAKWAGQSQTLGLQRSPRTKLVSLPDESERDFAIRVDLALRERRDQEMAKVRGKYASRVATLEDRLRRAEQAVQREEQQASESKMQAGVSVAATIFGALLGRKAVSASTLGRATTAARGMGRLGRETQDIARAQAEVEAVRARRDELVETLDRELQAIAARWESRDEVFERSVLKPKRGGVSVQLVALVWIPS
jgi:hypothetical protein